MQSKKSQGAIEFMIILTFIFIIMVFIMYFSGEKIVEINDSERRALAQNFADKINNELQILNKVEPGYKRELILHNNDYQLRLINSTYDGSPVTLELIDVDSNETYYFDLIGNYALESGTLDIDLSEREDPNYSMNVTVLTFVKKQSDNLKGIDLY